MSVGLVWFRRDLRLGDNPAWAAATSDNDAVVALYIIDPGLWERCHPRRIAQLASHLRALDQSLQERGGRLRIESGDSAELVSRVTADTGAERVYLNQDVSPYARARDDSLTVPVEGFWGGYVHPVGSVRTAANEPYLVFTPFHRAWAATQAPPWPESGDAAIASFAGEEIPDTMDAEMEGGERAARRRLVEGTARADRYQIERDRPDLETTSGLSIDLKWGTLSPRQVIAEIGTHTPSRVALVRQLAWREFYAQLLLAFPATIDQPLRTEYAHIQWRNDSGEFAAWKSGLTGYPIIDAGMRQLRASGRMHNRVRLLTASFLVKDLLIDWRWGERWFRRMLSDADTAQNVGNWQWVAGTGADAAPYFRVFNPILQARRFDPHGAYVRRWVPELDGLPAHLISCPLGIQSS
ncbi:MAG TPA: deoxyribodipyrimidine photo-lyase [Acidimicrobiia bacterium]|nr:deoxyribodipyrimidine photo-lyase [Acidimicrobiia bacterium]